MFIGAKASLVDCLEQDLNNSDEEITMTKDFVRRAKEKYEIDRTQVEIFDAVKSDFEKALTQGSASIKKKREEKRRKAEEEAKKLKSANDVLNEKKAQQLGSWFSSEEN